MHLGKKKEMSNEHLYQQRGVFNLKLGWRIQIKRGRPVADEAHLIEFVSYKKRTTAGASETTRMKLIVVLALVAHLSVGVSVLKFN